MNEPTQQQATGLKLVAVVLFVLALGVFVLGLGWVRLGGEHDVRTTGAVAGYVAAALAGVVAGGAALVRGRDRDPAAPQRKWGQGAIFGFAMVGVALSRVDATWTAYLLAPVGGLVTAIGLVALVRRGRPA